MAFPFFLAWTYKFIYKLRKIFYCDILKKHQYITHYEVLSYTLIVLLGNLIRRFLNQHG